MDDSKQDQSAYCEACCSDDWGRVQDAAGTAIELAVLAVESPDLKVPDTKDKHA
jgi:hypothetical protein